jgi:hypothetical protein
VERHVRIPGAAARRTLSGHRRDGHDELAADTDFFLGNGNLQAIEVWGESASGEPVQLPPALAYDKSDGYVVDLVGEGDALVVTMRVGAPGGRLATPERLSAPPGQRAQPRARWPFVGRDRALDGGRRRRVTHRASGVTSPGTELLAW